MMLLLGLLLCFLCVVLCAPLCLCLLVVGPDCVTVRICCASVCICPYVRVWMSACARVQDDVSLCVLEIAFCDAAVAKGGSKAAVRVLWACSGILCARVLWACVCVCVCVSACACVPMAVSVSVCEVVAHVRGWGLQAYLLTQATRTAGGETSIHQQVRATG